MDSDTPTTESCGGGFFGALRARMGHRFPGLVFGDFDSGGGEFRRNEVIVAVEFGVGFAVAFSGRAKAVIGGRGGGTSVFGPLTPLGFEVGAQFGHFGFFSGSLRES